MVDNSTNAEEQSPFAEILAARVRGRAAEVGLKQANIAERLRASTSAIGTYWHGKRTWPTEMLEPLAVMLNWSVEEMLTGRSAGSPLAAEIRASLARSRENDDAVEVQEIDLAYGLGGTFSDGPVEVTTHHFPRRWLEQITSTPAAQLTFARGRGDSMQPTIQDGDMVLIDRSQRTVREWDAIWALTVGDMAMIKRLRTKGDRVAILSDNDRVPTDDVFHEEVNIVGRVIFIGRRI